MKLFLKHWGVTALLALLPLTHALAECNGASWTPDSRYELRNNGSEVYDTQTQLLWKRCVEGMAWNGNTCSGDPINISWNDAVYRYPVDGKDWRLPNIDELTTLRSGTKPTGHVPSGCYDPAINPAVFPYVKESRTWSSSPVPSDPSAAWHIFAERGLVVYNKRSYTGAVRLVRAEQYLGSLGKSGRRGNALAEKKQEAAKRAQEEREAYRVAFKNASSSGDLSAFVERYKTNDPEKLVPKARQKIPTAQKQEAAKRTQEEREAYRAAFKNASSSSDLSAFVDRYKNNDPEKLVPKARLKIPAAQKREREQSARQVRETRQTEPDYGYTLGSPTDTSCLGGRCRNWPVTCNNGIRDVVTYFYSSNYYMSSGGGTKSTLDKSALSACGKITDY
ncbi:Protein of unknown function [Formivibrio citricus]|uniref:Lcl C-terminal domain-containing protein n=1 Tax=Formivibrio citricus TaxID=83765 RepID=A0A1I4VQD4_9NEIS|nr:DUF1566 domain-containing protein [Formivibrio citricus]SFN03478.1 Protein of unknown function [Formivibrio citricus]